MVSQRHIPKTLSAGSPYVYGNMIDEVDEFGYLGSYITMNGGASTGVKSGM